MGPEGEGVNGGAEIHDAAHVAGDRRLSRGDLHPVLGHEEHVGNVFGPVI